MINTFFLKDGYGKTYEKFSGNMVSKMQEKKNPWHFFNNMTLKDLWWRQDGRSNDFTKS